MKFKYMCFASEKYRKTGNCHYSIQAFYIIKMFTYLRAVVFDVLQINFCSGWSYGLINVINGTKLYMCPNYSKEKKEIKKEYVFTNCNLLCNTIIPNMQLIRLIHIC